MFAKKLTALAAILGAASAQQVCTSEVETHPSMTWSRCSEGGSCTTVQGSVVIDSNWRWTHTTTGFDSCYEGNSWTTQCTSGTNEECAQNCCVEGADYASTYGVTASGDSLTLQFVTDHEYGTNVGSRLYLLEDDSSYEMFTLIGNEFTFDVDVSNLGCGLNGALYFVSMDSDGGLAKYSGNSAGAKYGTGYCDAQCPRDVKWINGVGNVAGWVPSDNDANAGVGEIGTCCAEMDIWEANSMATAYTPHPCTTTEQHSCDGDTCGGTYSAERYAGTCDPDGCDFNPYRQGNESYYGPGLIVDTSRKLTVVTQFHPDASGTLGEIKRFYIQDGVVIPNSESTISGVPGNSITEEFCDQQKIAFGDVDTWNGRGSMTQFSEAVENGMVLTMSLWDDKHSNMLWLDSTYPVDQSGPGYDRGPCPTTGGVPAELEANEGDSTVTFSNIKFGPIGSTFNEDGTVDPPVSATTSASTTSTSAASTTTSEEPAATGVPQWGQCGGTGYTGPTVCESPYTCTYNNDWYSQCL